MRTTLNIDDDVLQIARELAAKERKTAGAVLSNLARRGVHTPPSGADEGRNIRIRNGIEMLPRRGEPVTLAHVGQIMEEEGI